jgi:F-type H+-transporting ATPase subunit alpha
MTVVILYALTKGFMDEVAIPQIELYQEELRDFISKRDSKLLNEIEKEARLTESITEQLDKALRSFNQVWFEKRGDVE